MSCGGFYNDYFRSRIRLWR